MKATRRDAAMLVFIVSTALSSCGDGPGGAARHVDDLADLAWVEDVRIGSVEDPDLGFSRIRQVRVSEKGEVYVLEGAAMEVRVFSADGERLRVVGGPGEGPGEFSLPLDMGLFGDTLWVTDGRARRITWFGPDGDVLFTTPTRGVPFESGVRGISVTLMPTTPRPDGLIQSGRMTMVLMDREIRPYSYPVVLFNRQAEIVDTVRWDTADVSAVTYRVGGRQAFAPQLGPVSPIEREMVDGSVVSAWSVPEGSTEGVLDVLRLGTQSDTLYHRKLRYDAIEVPGSVLDSLIAPRLATASAMGTTEFELERALRDAIRLPRFRPPVRDVYAGDDGTVWLQLNTPATDSTDWVLVGDDGSPRGILRLPLRMQIHHSAFPSAWSVELDEFDVPWLVRLSVERPDA